MKTMCTTETVSKRSKAVSKILNGFNASKAKVVTEAVNTWYQFLFGLVITMEELADLYFSLPQERLVELKGHLNNIANDFVGWKTFYNLNKKAAVDVIEMAYYEMLFCAKSFHQLESLIALPDDFKLKAKILEKMKLVSTNFNEKIKIIRYGAIFTATEWLELINLASFDQLTEVINLKKLSQKMTRIVFKKMLGLANNNFSRLIKVYHLLGRRSKLRKEILSLIVSLGNELKIDKLELLNYYEKEKTYTGLKKTLLILIEQMEWSVSERTNILINKCHRDAGLRRIMILDLDFSQLNSIVDRKEMDSATRRFVLLAMSRLVDDVKQMKIIEKTALQYNFNFYKIINSINKRINLPIFKVDFMRVLPNQRLAVNY
ncbi:MAG: hypothetical protein MUF50_04190 [Planctomycetes bacterium]|jgi:hypothetical protein|nr:hypothetical protein [Planctomycetota bacterium]